MRYLVLAGCWLICGWSLAVAQQPPRSAPGAAPAAPAAPPAAVAGEAEARKAVDASVAKFIAAYNAHDPKAIAALFVPEGQVIDEDENTFQGRAAIERLYADAFAERPESTIEVQVESVRPIGTALAVEVGSTTTIPAPGAEPEFGRYTALHVHHRDGSWELALVRDRQIEATNRDHLQSLAWLVGDWVDESRDGVVKTSCQWDPSGSFLIQQISVRQGEQEAMTVNQRIGWDPLAKRFKSWMFDSEGGYGEGTWTPTDTGWLIKATSVLSDGSTGSATHHLEPLSADRYVFRSVDRVAGSELLPPIQVNIVRQPPQPTAK